MIHPSWERQGAVSPGGTRRSPLPADSSSPGPRPCPGPRLGSGWRGPQRRPRNAETARTRAGRGLTQRVKFGASRDRAQAPGAEPGQMGRRPQLQGPRFRGALLLQNTGGAAEPVPPHSTHPRLWENSSLLTLLPTDCVRVVFDLSLRAGESLAVSPWVTHSDHGGSSPWRKSTSQVTHGQGPSHCF